ncbi:MAG: winged helix-turn-helix domain-containing tetratricopeptide repeat protein [Sulfitobacter sp.]
MNAAIFFNHKENLASTEDCTYYSRQGYVEGQYLNNPLERQAAIAVGTAVYALDSKLLTDSAGKEVLLRPKSSQVLAYLVSHAGQLVSRDEIFDTVWAGLEVSDDSLTQCISGIRRAIGDTRHKILQTVSKRGYILNVEAVIKPMADAPQAHSGPLSTASRVEALGTALDRTCLFIETSEERVSDLVVQIIQSGVQHVDLQQSDTGVMVVFADTDQALGCVFSIQGLGDHAIGIACGGTSTEQQARALSKLSAPNGITVSLSVRDAALSDPRLHFEDLGEQFSVLVDRQLQAPLRAFRATRGQTNTRFGMFRGDVLPTLAILPLRNGIDGSTGGALGLLFANIVTHELSRSHEVNVISSMSTASFSKNDVGLIDVRRLLNADFVLSGYFTEAAGMVRFYYEFADARTQRVLWSDSISTTQADIVGCFDASHVVAGQIRKAIVLNETLKIQSTPLQNLEAYSILYGAVGLMHRLSPVDFEKSKHLLTSLIESYRDHPTPLAWMARWHLLRVVQGWSDDPNQDSELAYSCTARALDIDPNHTLALVSEGQVLTHLKRKLDDAEHRYNTALEVNPNDANGRMLKAALLAFTDRGTEGLLDANRSLQLSPLDPHKFMNLVLAAGVNLSAGNDETAVDLARASYRLNRTHTSTLRVLAVAEKRCGNLARAKKAVSELLKLQPGLSVSNWLSVSPSASFVNGQEFASDLRSIGVPE